MLREFYYLSKPGIIGGNLFLAIAGFLLASNGHVKWGLFIKTIVAIALVIASAAALNNIFDRDIDANMKRTKKRAMVAGRLSDAQAYAYVLITGVAGFILLALSTNLLTVVVGAIGYIDYTWLYTRIKRRTSGGALVGSISGATPAVAGFTAVSGSMSLGAWLIGIVFVVWQMPHFYSIAIYRLREYKKAGIPVLPLKIGVKATKQRIISYIWLFTFAVIILGLSGYGGFVYLLVALASGALWLWTGLKDYDTASDQAWARSMFGMSLIVVVITCLNIALANWLP